MFDCLKKITINKTSQILVYYESDFCLVLTGEEDAVDPRERGTKVAPHYILEVPAGEERSVRVRFFTEEEDPKEYFGEAFDAVFDLRIKETDEFYDSVSETL